MSKLSENKALVSVAHLDVSFGTEMDRKQILFDISFDLFPNEILAIVGESGSGKSVTSRVLMGLLPKQTAHIKASKLELFDEDIRVQERLEKLRFRGSEIAMIFQEPMSSLNPTVACGNQVFEVLKIHTNLSKKQIKTEVIRLFKKVKLPDPESLYNKYPHEISGGQMQRVMIAMAIACKPKILIADEPTTALDVTVQGEVIQLVKELQQEYGLSVIFISHDLSLVKSIADRVMVMYQGKIVESNDVANIFNNPEHIYTKALLAAKPDVSKRVLRLPTIKDITTGTIKNEVVSKEDRKETHRNLYNSTPLLEVKNVSKDYEIKTPLFKPKRVFNAVNNVSFSLYEGESLGLVGESGCGKSTLGYMILGLRPVTNGSIWYNGIDITKISNREMMAYRKEIQLIFQDPFASLNPRLTVGQAIMEPMKWHGIGKNDVDRNEILSTLIQKVGLDNEVLNRFPHEFSGGQRQRIGIARTIALRPKIIVCDESVSALDISVQAQVLNLLNDLKKEYKFSYLFISHDLAVVKYFCDQVIVMNKGSIEEQNEADALFENPQMNYTKKLINAIP